MTRVTWTNALAKLGIDRPSTRVGRVRIMIVDGGLYGWRWYAEWPGGDAWGMPGAKEKSAKRAALRFARRMQPGRKE